MKKLLLSVSIFLLSGFAAADMQADSELMLTSEMAQPCRSWRFNSGGGYTCSSYAFNIWIPDARDVDRKIRQLEDRVSRLEAGLKRLSAESQKQ